MGNNLCCSEAPKNDLITTEQQGQNFVTPDTQYQQKVQNLQEEAVEEIQPIKEPKKVQQTNFPTAEQTEQIKQRVVTIQAPINSCLSSIYSLVPILTAIIDPTEQIITLKTLILEAQNSLQSLNRYWIGLYEQQDSLLTPEFLKEYENKVASLEGLLGQQRNQAQGNVKADDELFTLQKCFRDSLLKDDIITQLTGFIGFFETASTSFKAYSSIRKFFNNGFVLEHGLTVISDIEEELTSYLPAYIRRYSRGCRGFQVWNELFLSHVEVTQTTFIEKYAQRANIDTDTLRFILAEINNGTDTINVFEFLHFISENSEFFCEKGLVLQEKKLELRKEVTDNDDVCAYESKSDEEHHFRNGAVYYGSFENGKKEGKGKEIKYGITYEGGFCEGLYEGEGTLSFPDGSKYTGNFDYNEYHGQGTFVDYNGINFQGNWVNGLLTEGTITYENENKYEGQIKYNRFRHGKGTLKKSNGDLIFEGDFEFDEFANGTFYINGKAYYQGTFSSYQVCVGEIFYEDGTYKGAVDTTTFVRQGQGYQNWYKKQCLEGLFSNDAPSQAINYFDEQKKSKYEGDWKNFDRHGKGQFFYNSGALYEGEVVNNLRSGQGKYVFSNGNVYNGQWSNNEFSGFGEFNFSNGDKYIGQFLKGQFSGYGKYEYKNKNVYEGEWKADKWNGEGRYSGATGNAIKEGVWTDDKLTEQKEIKLKPELLVAPSQGTAVNINTQVNPEEQPTQDNYGGQQNLQSHIHQPKQGQSHILQEDNDVEKQQQQENLEQVKEEKEDEQTLKKTEQQ